MPPTNLVRLASPAFHYPASDRRATSDPSASLSLPPKIGSFQLFLDKFKGADVWLRENPLPQDGFLENGSARTTHDWNCFCGRIDDDEAIADTGNGGSSTFRWTRELLNQFKEELQKLVILDYLIRNTGMFSHLLALHIAYWL